MLIGYSNNPLPHILVLKMMEMKSTPSIQGPRDSSVLRDLCGAQVEAEEINFYGGKEMIIYRIILGQKHFTWHLL